MKVALLALGCLAFVCVAQDALFHESVGLQCSTSTDCGYVPALSASPGLYQLPEPPMTIADGSKRCQVVETQGEETGEMQTQYARNSVGESVPVAYCIEKNLFDPFTWKDVVATIIALVSTALGSGCGVGGGGLLVPMYIFFYGMSPKHAIPLSKATIFGNAVSAYFFNFNRKHPTNAKLPLINYQVAGIMEPTTLIGAIFGVMMNHMFPDWLILVLLVSLLSYITYKTVLKGNTVGQAQDILSFLLLRLLTLSLLQIREKESKYQLAVIKSVLKGGPDGGRKLGRQWSIYRRFDVGIAARRWLAKTRRNKKLRGIRAQDEADFESLPPLREHQPSSSDPLLGGLDKHDFGTFVSDDDQLLERRKAIEQREMKVFPLKYIIPLVLSWLVVLVQSMLRGGHGAPSIIGITCNSADYWMLTFLPLLILVAITLWVGHQLRLQNRLKVLCNYPFIQGDVHWIKRRVLLFPALCSMAGVAAGLLGIGGGMVKGPIMLEMGILPPVQSATANFMILFTSSSTTLQFAINGQFPGQLQYDYMAWFALMGCIGGFCGQKVVAYLVKKYRRESIMVYLLAVTIGCRLWPWCSHVKSSRNLRRPLQYGKKCHILTSPLPGEYENVAVCVMELISFVSSTQRFDVEVAARRWLNKTRRRRKARLIREEDEADFLSLPPLMDHQPTSSDPLVGQDKRQFGTFSSDDDNQAQRRNAIERREARVFPFEYLWPLALSWLLILVQSMLRGGHGAPSAIGVTCNSSTYWLLTLLPLVIPISVSLWMGYRLRLLNRYKVIGNYPFVEGDIHWIKRRVLMFPAVCTTAGVAAGLLGIGGGMVKGPIMLEAGVLPAVQSATASFMILFTASSTTLQFAINGQFPGEFQFDYMAWFAFMHGGAEVVEQARPPIWRDQRCRSGIKECPPVTAYMYLTTSLHGRVYLLSQALTLLLHDTYAVISKGNPIVFYNKSTVSQRDPTASASVLMLAIIRLTSSFPTDAEELPRQDEAVSTLATTAVATGTVGYCECDAEAYGAPRRTVLRDCRTVVYQTIGLWLRPSTRLYRRYCRPAAHDCNDHPGDVGYICQIVEVFNESTGEMEAQQGLTSAGDTVEAAYCVEKNLFSPFTYNDLLTTLIAFSCTALGAGGGIGGGGLLVPMYIFAGLNPKHAIPLSKVTIFGSAVAMYSVNFRRKHPCDKRPLIDFGLVGLMEPTTLVGTVFGVMLNHIFPNWLILVLLVTLLSFITYKTFLKGKKVLHLATGGFLAYHSGAGISSWRPWRTSAIGVTCDSKNYWVLTLMPLTVLLGISLYIDHRLRLMNRFKVLSNYPFMDGDLHWIKRRVLMFPAVCTTAGVAAGLLGIGGGMVKGPIMLEAGVLPAVQSATASFMILFTASSTTLQFAINGQFPGEFQFDYMAWFAFVGFLGGFCGLKCVGFFVKKYKRESIMVYMLATTIGLSALAMGFIGLRSTLADIESGVHLGFHGICDNE
ncbi:Transmembrane protein TauE-like [Phytophthora cactorum]|nr:Transmembrane protein TauE-like [Phytophthora cactorum]